MSVHPDVVRSQVSGMIHLILISVMEVCMSASSWITWVPQRGPCIEIFMGCRSRLWQLVQVERLLRLLLIGELHAVDVISYSLILMLSAVIWEIVLIADIFGAAL